MSSSLLYPNSDWYTVGAQSGFPGDSVVKDPNLPANSGDTGSHCWVRKIPWRRKWLPTPVFLPGKSHGQKSLVGYSPRGRERARRNLATKQQQPIISVNYSDTICFLSEDLPLTHPVIR